MEIFAINITEQVMREIGNDVREQFQKASSLKTRTKIVDEVPKKTWRQVQFEVWTPINERLMAKFNK